MGKNKQGLSVREVEIENVSGGRIRFNTQESVNKTIWDEVHRKRYFLTESAPICKGRLKGDFGYLAMSHSAKKLYAFPDNMDEATKEICEEVASIRQMIPKDSESFLITKETW